MIQDTARLGQASRPLFNKVFCPTLRGAFWAGRLGVVLLAFLLWGGNSKAAQEAASSAAAAPPSDNHVTPMDVTAMLGGRPAPATQAGRPASAENFFPTPFQTESQFIVESIVTDLAEQMYYAAHQQLPDDHYFSVTATEKPNSPRDSPVYELQIRLDAKTNPLDLDLNVNGPIWSPELYEGVGTALAGAVGMTPSAGGSTENTKRLAKLLDSTPETIVKEDQTLSAALEADFTNPELHEQAALLLGAFAFRDHAGNFFELRLPLGRLTAHLAMAHFLRGDAAYGINGRMAEAFELSLSGNEVDALGKLNALGSDDAAVAAMARALRAYNTWDYRPLNAADGLSPMECVQWFGALAHSAGVPVAWSKLNDQQKQTIDFVRLAHQAGYSVEIGHELLANSLKLEMEELASVHMQEAGSKLTRSTLVRALNELPGRTLATDTNGAVRLQVIGGGLWADFLQRQLCYAVHENFNFMQHDWGVPDEAKVFAGRCAQAFGGLRLYPFVRRMDFTTEQDCRQAVDAGLAVVMATPQLVPAGAWNSLNYQTGFGPLYLGNRNPGIDQWFSHNPPPGTAYDLAARLTQPTLIERLDAIPFLEKLHARAPGNGWILNYLFYREYGGRPSHEQALALFSSLLPYDFNALKKVAATLQDHPDQYEVVMLQAAGVNPSGYYTLSDYCRLKGEPEKAADYLEKACATDLDSVRVSNYALRRVEHFLQAGQVDRARQIADEAGEVYSSVGLEAKAKFFELTSNYDGAYEWYAKIEERYNESLPLVHFCVNYQARTGDPRFRPEVEKRQDTLFPDGLKTISFGDFHGPPAAGVRLGKMINPLLSTGLNEGDVIVAIYGVRTLTPDQYEYVRDGNTNPELDLIVWQTNAYHELKISPPGRRFGAPMSIYQGGR